MWIINPFSVKIQDNNLSMHLKESLNLSSDEIRKFSFQSFLPRFQCWLSIRSTYPFLSEKDMTNLIHLSKTYLCEKAVSSISYQNTIPTSVWINTVLCLAVTTLDSHIHNLIWSRPIHLGMYNAKSFIYLNHFFILFLQFYL